MGTYFQLYAPARRELMYLGKGPWWKVFANRDPDEDFWDVPGAKPIECEDAACLDDAAWDARVRTFVAEYYGRAETELEGPGWVRDFRRVREFARRADWDVLMAQEWDGHYYTRDRKPPPPELAERLREVTATLYGGEDHGWVVWDAFEPHHRGLTFPRPLLNWTR